MCFSVAAMASRCTMLGVRLLLHGFFSFLRDSRPPPRALSALAPAESRPKYLSRAIDLVAPCARATGEAGLRRIDPMDQKRTQEASETNFTTRGGRPDATAGTGKPHTSPCKRGPEIPDEAGTVGEQAPAASLAWVLTTCAETVVECTDKEDFGDACVAVGPVHCAQLQTETVPRLLLRENRELVIEQGRGWA